jgi:hypothetical protein
MDYAEARPQIKTGDLIAVKETGFEAFVIRTVTGSPYTHTATAIWAGNRLLIAETNPGGCRLAPLSQYAIDDFDVFNCPTDRNACERAIWNELGSLIEYNYLDCLRIFGYKVFGIPLPKVDGPDLICSALSATIYKKAGWAPSGLPSIPWPGAVTDQLQNVKKFEVTASA